MNNFVKKYITKFSINRKMYILIYSSAQEKKATHCSLVCIRFSFMFWVSARAWVAMLPKHCPRALSKTNSFSCHISTWYGTAQRENNHFPLSRLSKDFSNLKCWYCLLPLWIFFAGKTHGSTLNWGGWFPVFIIIFLCLHSALPLWFGRRRKLSSSPLIET